jgi:hypothetical protein
MKKEMKVKCKCPRCHGMEYECYKCEKSFERKEVVELPVVSSDEIVRSAFYLCRTCERKNRKENNGR